MRIEWAQEVWELDPERALGRPGDRTVFIADPHFGKGATFREAGRPIPGATLRRDLDRLARVLARHRAERLVVLGDLLHAKPAQSPEVIEELARWRAAHASLDVLLVRGNHDRSAGDPPAALGFGCEDEPRAEGRFCFVHDPAAAEAARDAGPALAGHLHPSFGLGDADGFAATVPVFWLRPSLAILPAFGGLTGGRRVRAAPGDRLWGVCEGDVIDLSAAVGPAPDRRRRTG